MHLVAMSGLPAGDALEVPVRAPAGAQPIGQVQNPHSSAF
jgi:hypothetical protein